MKVRQAIVSLAALLVAAYTAVPAAQAALIPIAPTNVTVSTELVGFNRIGDHTVNGSGLAAGAHTNVPAATMWLSTFGGSIDPDPFIVFDFGSVYAVNSFHVWNYNESGLTNRGVKGVTVMYTDTLTFGTNSTFNSTVAGVTSFSQASGLTGYTGQNFSGFTPFNARYVLFEIDEGVGVGNHGGDSYGLSEVQFDGTAVGAAPKRPMEFDATVASFSSQFGGREAAKSADGSGLDIRGYHSTAVNTMWLSNAETTPEIVYDLGKVDNIGKIEIWNYNESDGGGLSERGVNEVEVFVSDDNVSFKSVGTYFFSQATEPENDDNDFSQTVDLDTMGRYIKLDVKSNHGDGTYTGLSEVKFYERTPILGVTAAASSQLIESGFDRGASRTVDGSGLDTETRTHTGVPDSNMWLSGGVGFGAPGNDDSDPQITFDLGVIHRQLDSIRVWNYNETTGTLDSRGVQDTRILISADGIGFTPLTDPTDLDQVFRFDRAAGLDNVDFSQLIELNLTGVAVRFVRFDIISTWGGSNFDTPTYVDFGFVGLSEVRFFGVVPAPAALPAGLTMLGLLAARRRRRGSN